MFAQIDARALLRAGLLEGSAILCAGARGPLGEEVARVSEQLGARVSWWDARGATGELDVLCYDGAATFARAAGKRAALDECLDGAWEVTRALVADALPAADGGTRAHPARIVYIAPAAGAGAHADAARAGLENLARTLSIEWARFGVTTIAIAPGADSAPGELGALVAFLCSRAGGYFSGCLLDLRGPAVSLPS